MKGKRDTSDTSNRKPRMLQELKIVQKTSKNAQQRLAGASVDWNLPLFGINSTVKKRH